MYDSAFEFAPVRLCSCQSGNVREAKYDARGIFLTYACEDCAEEKLSRYRPEVLTDSNYEHDEPIEEDV